MKRIYIILFIALVFILLLVGLYWFKNRRTAYSVAHTLTNIEISKEYKIETFKDKWFSNGDGESLIIFSIPKEQQSNLVQLCISKGFRKLPIKENLPDNLIYNYINQADSLGYYSLSTDIKDDRNYKLVVINQLKEKLILHNVIY